MGNSGIFDVWEAVQIAIEEEHHGLRFYEALIACAQDPALRTAAKRFAEEERAHKGAFSEMLATLGLLLLAMAELLGMAVWFVLGGRFVLRRRLGAGVRSRRCLFCSHRFS